MKAPNSNVCLLYSESDRAIANKLEEALKYYSVDIWQPQNIEIGAQIFIETKRAIEKAKIILVLWSINSVQDALLIELATEAKKAKKVLIHVLLERVKVPLEFTGIKTADLVGWSGDKKNEQIVQVWMILQKEFFSLQNNRLKHFKFSTFLSSLGLIATVCGAIFTLANRESRCFFKLEECSTKEVSNQETSTPSEKSSPSPLTTVSSPETFPQKAETSTIDQDFNLKFELTNCQRTGEKVTCNVLITNLANQDKTIKIIANNQAEFISGTYYYSRSIDFSGNQYTPKVVQIGESQDTVITTSLIPRIPIKASLSFKIPQDVTQLRVLQIEYSNGKPSYSPDFQRGKVELPNIGIVVSN